MSMSVPSGAETGCHFSRSALIRLIERGAWEAVPLASTGERQQCLSLYSLQVALAECGRVCSVALVVNF